MKVRHYTDVPATEVEDGAKGVQIRWIITQDDGAPHFAMRHFEIAPGGHTPHHAHPWEHEVFVLTGSGKVVGGDGETPLAPGSVCLVPGDEVHHFETVGDESMTLLCLVPHPDPCDL